MPDECQVFVHTGIKKQTC